MKRFYLRLPKSIKKLTITVDDDDAWRLRSQFWRASHDGKVYLKLPGKLSVSLGQEICGVPGWVGVQEVFHKNDDKTDFRKENLVVINRQYSSKSGFCKAGHDLSEVGTYAQFGGFICAGCRRENQNAKYREKVSAKKRLQPPA